MDPNSNPSAAPQSQSSRSDGSDIHPLVVLQPGERVVCEIKRHPFGIITQYLMTGLLIVVALAVGLFVAPQLSNSSDTAQAAPLVYGALGILVIFALGFLAVASSIYWKNRWIVTTDSITQILQPSLFGRQVSQLSMDDLEDITVQQTGVLQTMFNFGTLRAETAGERSKFVFIYCPNPNYYARQVLIAREEFMNFKRYNEGAQHPSAHYAPPPTPQGSNSPQ